MPKPAKRYQSLPELARVMGVGARTLRAYRAAGMPQEPGGGWCVATVKAWLAERDRARIARRRKPLSEAGEIRQMTRVDQLPPDSEADILQTAPPAPGVVGFDADVDLQLRAGAHPQRVVMEQEARRRYWLAEEQRTQARQLAGTLVEAAGVMDKQIQLCAAFRRMFLDFCRRAAPLVLGLEDTLTAQQVLEREAETALARIQQLGGIPT